MQRQAVPLLVTEPPIVATGSEVDVASNSGIARPCGPGTAGSSTPDSEQRLPGYGQERLKDGGEGARVDLAPLRV